MGAILFALTTYFSWGIGDIFNTSATRKLGGYSMSLWLLAFRTLIYSLLIPFVIQDLKNLTAPLLFLNILIGSCLVIGCITFFEGLRVGSASLVGAISSSFGAVTVILSTLFLHEKMSASQIVAILVIFAGLALTTFNIHDLKQKKIFHDKTVIWGFITFIMWGIYFAFLKIPIQHIGWFWPSYITFSLFPLIYIFMKIKRIQIHPPNYKNAALMLIIGVTITAIGDFTYNYAVSKSMSSLVAPIASASPTLFVPLAYFIFKDHLTRQQVIGILVTLVGIVLLSLFSA